MLILSASNQVGESTEETAAISTNFVLERWVCKFSLVNSTRVTFIDTNDLQTKFLTHPTLLILRCGIEPQFLSYGWCIVSDSFIFTHISTRREVSLPSMLVPLHYHKCFLRAHLWIQLFSFWYSFYCTLHLAGSMPHKYLLKAHSLVLPSLSSTCFHSLCIWHVSCLRIPLPYHGSLLFLCTCGWQRVLWQVWPVHQSQAADKHLWLTVTDLGLKAIRCRFLSRFTQDSAT